MEVPVTGRRRPTKRQVAEVHLRQGGRCSICEGRLGASVEYDHIHALWIGGGNETANFRALCIPCHKLKTFADTKARAKTKRLEARRLGTAKFKVKRRWPKRSFP